MWTKGIKQSEYSKLYSTRTSNKLSVSFMNSISFSHHQTNPVQSTRHLALNQFEFLFLNNVSHTNSHFTYSYLFFRKVNLHQHYQIQLSTKKSKFKLL